MTELKQPGLPHDMSVRATPYGTIFVRGEDTAMDLSVEQADALCARLLDALSTDFGGSGASSHAEGIGIVSHRETVTLVRHKPLSYTQVSLLVKDIGDARDKAAATRGALPPKPAPAPPTPQPPQLPEAAGESR